MTISFHPNIKISTLGSGIMAAGFTSAKAITVYAGTQPTAAAIVADWTANYTSGNANFLAHYSGVIWTQTSNVAVITTFPTASNTVNTGTGTWCVLWTTNPLLAAMSGAIPTTSFIVAPVSDIIGKGVIKYTNVSFVSGTAKSIDQGTLSIV